MAITVVSSAPPATTSSSPLSPQQEKASDVFSQLLGERLSADKAVEALVSDPKSIDSKVSSALAASPQTSEITGLSTKRGHTKRTRLIKRFASCYYKSDDDRGALSSRFGKKSK